MTLLAATTLLLVVMDPFGNVPIFVGVLQAVRPQRRTAVLVRELLIAFVVLTAFLFVGPFLLAALQISAPSLRIAGGIVLFLIAIKMVFGATQEFFSETSDGEPLIVPLAVPAVAGPSTAATLLILVGQAPERWPTCLLALTLASLANGAVLLVVTRIAHRLGRRALSAIERLMGLLLTAVAVEMGIGGIRLLQSPAP